MLVIEGIDKWHACSLGTPTHRHRLDSKYEHHPADARDAIRISTLRPMARSASPPLRGTFPLFGFPTTVKPGFAAFVVLLAFLYPFPLGLWVAGAVALFTVIHELGHALAARFNKCDASIALDFMVAYATYEPPAPLTWRQKIAITLSGPTLQIGSAMIALVAFGINPFSRQDIASSEFAAAVWWAGIALGALNLIPIAPLDGGAIVGEVAERIFPQRGKLRVLQISFALTIIGGAISLFAGVAGLVPLFAFMLILQWQQLFLPHRLRKALTQSQLAPQGNPEIDGVVISSMLDLNEHNLALSYATQAYTLCPSFDTAFGAARAALAQRNLDLSAAWLRAAASSQITTGELQRSLRHFPEFAELRPRLDIDAEWFTN